MNLFDEIFFIMGFKNAFRAVHYKMWHLFS
jgi:hypothetical protein